MGVATVVSMTVRPSQVSHLCFEVGGILGDLNTDLGKQAKLFDFQAFYGTLGGFPTSPATPTVPADSRLLYGPHEIDKFVQSATLAALRAEGTKAALDKAINARQNAFFAKYGNVAGIVHKINEFYSLSPSPAFANNKPHRLDKLSTDSERMTTDLLNAYVAHNRDRVIETTESVLHSKTWGGGSKVEESNVMESLTDITSNQSKIYPQDNGQLLAMSFDNNPFDPTETLQEGTSGETIKNTGKIKQTQKIVNTDYGYRHPAYEAKARNERAQISLMDQKFAQFMYSQNLPHLDLVFRNELNSIDSDVYSLQIAYLNTILLSPIRGTVTGVYKNPGDCVQAGEPVIRVENDNIVFLVGTVRYSGAINIGNSITVGTSSLFGSTPLSPSITGSVVAVRSQGQEDQWAVVVQSDNLAAGRHIFPLGYQFDYDDTTVTIN